MAEQGPYEHAVEQAANMLAQARLNDPGEHFPYKHDTVIDLLEQDPPMGYGTPGRVDGAQDRSRLAEDYMTPGIAAASRDYIDAQAEFLADRSAANQSAYETARDRLVAARYEHRRNRDGSTTVATARKAG